MKKSLPYICRLLCFIFFSVNSSAQTRTCGVVEYMNIQLQDPEFARKYQENQTKFNEALKRRASINVTNFNRLIPVIVPVAVHFPEAQESDRACLEALAQNQIDIINADFTASNSDANLWTNASSFYPDVNHGVANIEFRIANQNHPSGLDAELLEGSPAVTIGYNFGNGNDQDPNWSGYMNFVVKDIGSENLGRSPLGGSISAGQSVVMNLKYFGSGEGCSGSNIVPETPYDLGRTVTHELGHFFNLDHPWGGDGGCDFDDGIDDTPNISTFNGGCPVSGSVVACEANEKALTMNYMDYVNDACMYMFTEGQITVVESYLEAIKDDFKSDVLGVHSEVFEAFSIYPNPNKGSFNVKFQAASNDDIMIHIYDIRGRKIYNNSFETSRNFNQTVNLENVQSGVYLLNVSNGDAQVVKRIIIH